MTHREGINNQVRNIGKVEEVGTPEELMIDMVEGAANQQKEHRCMVEDQDEASEMSAIKLMSGEMRWIEMGNRRDMKNLLLEERKLEDQYHARRNKWRQPTNHEEEWGESGHADLDTTQPLMEAYDGDVMLEEYIDQMVEDLRLLDISVTDQERYNKRPRAE